MQHTPNCSDLLSIYIGSRRHREKVPEQLVGTINQVDIHRGMLKESSPAGAQQSWCCPTRDRSAASPFDNPTVLPRKYSSQMSEDCDRIEGTSSTALES